MRDRDARCGRMHGYIRAVEVLTLLRVLRRRWLAIVLCFAVGLAAGVGVTRSTTPIYRSTARLFVNIPGARGVNEALAGVELSSQLLASYARVATSRSAAQRIIDELELDLSVGDIQSRLSAVPEHPTLLLTVSATGNSPEEARAITSAAADAFVEIVDELEADRVGAIEPIVIDRAQLPATPVEPVPRENLLLGAGLGLMIGAGLALLLDALDRSVHGPADLVRLTGKPLLGIVPRRKDFEAHPVVTADDTGTSAAEAYRVLRTGVRFADLGRPLKTILVTSPMPGDGKTATAANLAVAIAQGGDRVLLVDADLRRSRIPRVMDVPSEPGLTSVVLGDVTEQAAIRGIAERLFVLPPGPLPPNPSEILGSSSMAELINRLSTVADVVVFDGPPVVPVTDAQVLAALVDGVIFVAHDGRTTRDAIEEAIRRLDLVGAHIVGAVLNGASRSGEYSEDYRYAAYAATDKRGRFSLRKTLPGDAT